VGNQLLAPNPGRRTWESDARNKSAIRSKYELCQESIRTFLTPGISASLAGRMQAIIIKLKRVIAVLSEP
jgi:hypothetical protein